MLKKIEQLVKVSESVSFAVITNDGFPYVVEMEKVMNKGMSELYFITRLKSKKVNYLFENQKSGVSIRNGEDSISFIGNTEVLSNPDLMTRILPQNYLDRLYKRGISKYCVLYFKTLSLKAYINGEFETIFINEIS